MDIKDFKNKSDVWKNIEEKTIDTMLKETNIKEPQVRLFLAQSKQSNVLGYGLKYIRQKKRISVKKMAEKLKTSEENIKKIESEEIVNFPLKLIIVYLNNLGWLLTFQPVDFKEEPKRG